MSNETESLQARYDRLLLLYNVSEVIHSTLEPEEALGLILREAIRLTKAVSGSVCLINPTNGFLEIQASQGLPVEARELRLRIGEGITGWVAKKGMPARVGDVRNDARYVPVRPEVVSELAVPLEVHGESRGVLNVDADRPDAFSASDQELLQALAIPAARVIHNTWLYEQLRLKARLFESLFSVGQAINSTVNLDDTLQVITREAASLMSAKVCALHLLDTSREWLELRANFGAGPAYRDRPPLSASESALGVVVRRKKPIQIENVQNSSLYQNVTVAQVEGLASLLSVPLLFNKEATGTLSVYTGSSYSFSNEEIRILTAFAELSALAIEKARLYERIVDIEEELRQNERLSALGLLAAEVAHEIRNPLTVMKMLYHSMNLQFPENDPRGVDAKMLAAKMDSLDRTVEQILDFARSTEPSMGPVNVNELIDNLHLLLRHKLRHQGVEFTRDLGTIPLISGDATQLEQAFLNLMLNAVQAMPQGGQLTVQTTADTVASLIRVRIIDTGTGMTAYDKARVFGSLLGSRKAGGTGLGLAIVRRVVETHQGAFEIQSEPGKGTTMIVSLPL